MQVVSLIHWRASYVYWDQGWSLWISFENLAINVLYKALLTNIIVIIIIIYFNLFCVSLQNFPSAICATTANLACSVVDICY
jgi:hypothetical protein